MIDTLTHILLEPLQHEFMRRAVVEIFLVSSLCALFSCILVLRGWALMGDAISHAVLPGIAGAYVLGWPLSIGAFVAGMSCAMGTRFFKHHSRIKEDAVMGILFSGLFALGLVMIVNIHTDVHLLHILFGNVLGVTWGDIQETFIMWLAGIGFLIIRRRDIMTWCFDPVFAASTGMNIKKFDVIMLGALAVVIVTALKATGVLLVVAMLIAPGAIAFMIAHNTQAMVMASLSISLLASMFGIWISYYADVATAPLIVVIEFFVFIIAVSVSKKGKIAKGAPA